jgi:hypothetical protein
MLFLEATNKNVIQNFAINFFKPLPLGDGGARHLTSLFLGLPHDRQVPCKVYPSSGMWPTDRNVTVRPQTSRGSFPITKWLCRALHKGCTLASGEAFPKRSPCRTCATALIGRTSLFYRKICNRPQTHTIRSAFQNSSMQAPSHFLSESRHRR